MQNLQSFYHAFYEFLYAMGRKEGEITGQFRMSLRLLLKQEFKEQEYLIDFVTQGNTMDTKIAHMWAMSELRKSIDYLKEDDRSKVMRVLNSFLEQHPEAKVDMDELRKGLELIHN